MAEALTDRQLDVLRLIAAGVRSGLPPTNRELCETLGFTSTNSMACHLKALIKKGRIEKQPHRARAISLTELGWREVDT